MINLAGAPAPSSPECRQGILNSIGSTGSNRFHSCNSWRANSILAMLGKRVLLSFAALDFYFLDGQFLPAVGNCRFRNDIAFWRQPLGLYRRLSVGSYSQEYGRIEILTRMEISPSPAVS